MKRRHILPIIIVMATAVAFGVFTLAAHAQYIAPTTPTGVSATFTPPSQVLISWTAPTDTSNVAGYYVYRNGGFISATAGLSVTDTVQPGIYSYTVAAFDESGNTFSQSSAPSAQIAVTLDTTAPTTPTALVASGVTTSSISLSWNGSTDNVGVMGYYIYRDGVRVNTSTVTTASYTDANGLMPNVVYTYSVSAYDASGNVSTNSNQVRASVDFDVTPPTLSSSFGVVATSSSEIDLSWQPAVDNVGVTGYYIYRDGVQVATVNGSSTSYADGGLGSQTTHSYWITAYDAAGNISAQSASLNATTLTPDTIPPFTPTGLTAIGLYPTEVDLSWHPTTDNVGVTGYDVYRNWAQIGTVTGNTSTTFNDTGLASGTAYTYAVDAYDAAGNISLYDTIQVMTPATMATATIPPPVVIPPAPTTPSSTPPLSSSGTATPPPVMPTAPVLHMTGIAPFTTALYLGLRSTAVKNLQTILIQQGDLNPAYATGLFGALTQKALQQFQCAESIVCYGSPASTGWGQVGAKTRKALNAVL